MRIVIPWNELEFLVSRSSGAGGQHVNKTNSAVQLKFSVTQSLVLTEDQKKMILNKLKSRIVQDEFLLVRSEDQRDQKSNKETAYRLLHKLIEKALIVPKKRIPTKVKRSAVEKRIETKKIRSGVKQNRSKKINWE
jgi:ribosome-associated protein